MHSIDAGAGSGGPTRPTATPIALVAAGGLALLVGIAGLVLMFFQPWAVCDHGDTSTECALTGTAVTIQNVFLLLVPVGVLILGLGLLWFARTAGGTVPGGGDTVSR